MRNGYKFKYIHDYKKVICCSNCIYRNNLICEWLYKPIELDHCCSMHVDNNNPFELGDDIVIESNKALKQSRNKHG